MRTSPSPLSVPSLLAKRTPFALFLLVLGLNCGAPAFAWSLGVAGVCRFRAPHFHGRKESQHENLLASVHTSAATTREEEAVLSADCDRELIDLFRTVPLAKHGSSSRWAATAALASESGT